MKRNKVELDLYKKFLKDNLDIKDCKQVRDMFWAEIDSLYEKHLVKKQISKSRKEILKELKCIKSKTPTMRLKMLFGVE
jgi:uncharacterized protein YeeX (DUF496 family)